MLKLDCAGALVSHLCSRRTNECVDVEYIRLHLWMYDNVCFPTAFAMNNRRADANISRSRIALQMHSHSTPLGTLSYKLLT